MKLIKKILVMFLLLTPAIAHSQSTTNSIYIEQIGDGSTILIEQTGNTNTVGNVSSDIPVTLDGSTQNITITQDGNGNSFDGNIEGNNITASFDTTGSTNDINVDIGSTAAGGSTIDVDIVGDSNVLDYAQGDLNSATNADVTLAITGDFNTFDGSIETDDVTNVFGITGDSNDFTVVQDGYAGKNVDMSLTGSNNTVAINQRSTLNVDSVNVTSTTSNSTITINQCDSTGC